MKLNYRTTGTGRPVIILHGLFGMSDNWQTFAKQLAERGYAVTLADLRNHGHSPHSPEHTYALMALDVEEMVKDTGMNRPVIIGHSMGGKVAMELVNNNPALAGKIIIIDISPFAYPVHHATILKALNAVNLNAIKSRAEAEKIMAADITDVPTRQFLLKNLYWVNDNQLGWRFNLPVIDRLIDEVGEETLPAKAITLPVLFVRGGKSNYISPALLPEIQKYYPSAQLITVEGAGHWVHAEKPDELLTVITDFINEG